MDCVTSTLSTSVPETQVKSPASSSPSGSPGRPSFHRRFRSSPSTSTSDRISSPDPTSAVLVTKAEAARSAKRILLATLRDDWSYPCPESQVERELTYRDPLDYRIREDGSSDPEPLSDEPYDGRDPMVFTDSDPYKFENPDAVASSIGERKRKRRRVFKEELEWNTGLRTWADRRDAWCGAVKTKSKGWDAMENHSNLLMALESPTPASPTSQISAGTCLSMLTTAETQKDDETERPDQSALLPVYPSLLPNDNPIRASITPAMYPAIYSKVVLQSLTPTVPVPLPHMLGAMVQGWKSEGNWPPTGSGATTSIIQEGGRRASELLKFRRRENVVVEKGRMRKGVGAVKKALGLRTSNDENNGTGLNFEDPASKPNSTVDESGLLEEDTPGPS